MNVVGLTPEEQNDIFRIIAAILWIGNIQFVESEDGGGSTITDQGVTVSTYITQPILREYAVDNPHK